MGKFDNPSRKAAQEKAVKELEAAWRERDHEGRLRKAHDALVKAEHERMRRFIGYRGR